MCTFINKTQKNRPKTAKKDIIVYKTGDIDGMSSDVLVTAHYSHRYIKDVLNETTFQYDDYFRVSDSVEMVFAAKINPLKRLFVTHGFHSYESLERMKKATIYGARAEFVIPKGAKYFHNGAGNLVSNQIIFKRFIPCVQ